MSTTDSKSAPTGTMTYEEFLDWADEDTLAEWVDGKVIMTSPASLPHQEVGGFLYEILQRYVTFRQLGKILPPPFQMKLPHSSGREPDLIFVAQAHLGRLKRTYLDGPADLVVEVVTPESLKRDREEKFAEYQRAGIPEYWILDPDTQQADFYQLDTAQGIYLRINPDAQGSYHSGAVAGFWLQVAWLWQDPLPSQDEALYDIIGKPYADYQREQMRKRGF